MDQVPVGMAALREWRRVPRAVRRSYASGGQVSSDEHARAALGYAHLALSGLGFLIFLGPAALILVGFGVAMAIMDIGPDTFDVVLFVGLMVFVTFNHVRVAGRIRVRADRVLRGTLG
jgi:hypothetical protein